ncbi:DUF2958 domain-containing protein [Dyadobacter sp. CY327]|uniref:DUF2958 domain-containing protein n=1 Tax=Dyadobacter sp. CY327 TaxID=2907301 RepID=UPI001F1616E2|nr:DUF2958 domain-containing protein [Dyadobacter sp. CY327]MCE7073712.1 DUF2958 domain-containing protein [Dyadobacter sp. CY327]
MSRLIPDDLKAQMIRNHYDVTQEKAEDHPPVVMLSSLDDTMIWLLSEYDPFYDDIAFGLCDLGMGSPELGDVSITELESVKWPRSGIPFIVQDKDFVPSYPMSVYAEAARMCQQITIDPDQLAMAAAALKHRPS